MDYKEIIKVVAGVIVVAATAYQTGDWPAMATAVVSYVIGLFQEKPRVMNEN